MIDKLICHCDKNNYGKALTIFFLDECVGFVGQKLEEKTNTDFVQEDYFCTSLPLCRDMHNTNFIQIDTAIKLLGNLILIW